MQGATAARAILVSAQSWASVVLLAFASSVALGLDVVQVQPVCVQRRWSLLMYSLIQ